MLRSIGGAHMPQEKPPETFSVSGGQTVDQSNGFRQFDESFDQTFSKVCAVEGAEPSSPSADGEISLSASLFDNFFSAPSSCREKVAMAFVHFLFQLPFVYNLTARNLFGFGRFFACLYHEHNRPALLDVSVLGGVEAGCSYILSTDRMKYLHGDLAA